MARSQSVTGLWAKSYEGQDRNGNVVSKERLSGKANAERTNELLTVMLQNSLPDELMDKVLAALSASPVSGRWTVFSNDDYEEGGPRPQHNLTFQPADYEQAEGSQRPERKPEAKSQSQAFGEAPPF